MIKLGISGSRQFSDYDRIKADILKSFNPSEISIIISGGAIGVDKLCERFAEEFNIPIELHKPEYTKYGRMAPIIRNKEIVDNCDILIAWPLEEVSRGTYFTINYAKEKGKDVIINVLNNHEDTA